MRPFPGVKTQVAIVGAGPAGLLLSHLLQQAGIDSVVLEKRSQAEVETASGAGVLEQGSVELLNSAGLGDRLCREGLVHHGIELRFDGRAHRIPLSELANGRAITSYAQHEILKDLIGARVAAGGALLFETKVGAIHAVESTQPTVRYEQHGRFNQLRCDFVVGCDGFHSVVRNVIPATVRREYQTIYPFGWFGILLESPRLAAERIYARHERGFALVTSDSNTLQRLYFQCDPERIANWPDEKILDELRRRLFTHNGWSLDDGAIVQKDVLSMRSFVCETMRFGRVLLAGDAAHLLPPTGAKGMNLAFNDVRLLAHAVVEFYRTGRETALQQYPERCLERIWAAQRFSWWMTSILHRFNDNDLYRQRLQRAELEHVVNSRAAATALAEVYVG